MPDVVGPHFIGHPANSAEMPHSYALISSGRIGTAIDYIHLSIPQVQIRLVILRSFLLLALNLGQAFLLLISHSRGLIRCFATNQECADCAKGNELKVFHI